MSQSPNPTTPTLPKPQPETTALLQPVWWKRPATWTAIGTGIVGAILTANQIVIEVSPHLLPLLSPHKRDCLIGLGLILGAVASHLNGWRGVNAGGRVMELPGNNNAPVNGQEQ